MQLFLMLGAGFLPEIHQPVRIPFCFLHFQPNAGHPTVRKRRGRYAPCL